MARSPQITQQRFAEIARKMLDDPDLRGDVLLFGLALAETLTRSDPDLKEEGWTRRLSVRAGNSPDWVRYAVMRDLPRHEPVYDRYTTCVGQMIRRPGLCGRPSTQRHYMHDAITGEVTVVGSCTRHHDQVNTAWHAATQAWIAAGRRPGPQNTGGILERYFGGNWDRFYAWARPGWTRPEAAIEVPRRPHLTLIIGGLEDTAG